MKRLLVLFLGCMLFSCGKDSNNNDGLNLEGKYVIPASTTDTLFHVRSGDGTEIPVFLSIPVNSGSNHPGMVVMHGSGGPWVDSDTDSDDIADEVEVGSLSSQNRAWQTEFDTEGIISAFPGSYYARGTIENEGEWKDPPLQFQISASFIRNQDAYLTLDVLRNLVWENGDPIVRSDNIGILGFSHGATAIQSSIFDQAAIPMDWEWTQRYDGVTYTTEILPPAALPEAGGFKTAVMYYPGSFHNSYYGNPCTGTSIFQTTIDFQIHIASQDPLTDNTHCMLETVENNGGGEAAIYNYEGAAHSFDNKSTGTDGNASVLARTRTMDWITSKLGIN
ncbi:MAG: dienelactone hydrolase family protein [Balneolales bacterium]|nr:dienelactone hydrolase family protein [Balneolales bacterium]